ncbi:NusG domain II-containing protein [Acholeplasma manati]|uniref:NusG domain II-containing protein n=1 Tax=Paracholeplasma manati TaxID=591373 RepID=A0ABT2Y560_9MOLU|nr:NusG domain II-containing protein [Paracholeplasma manati]MCV2231583.1 NusG domain II-containing protein [Paracholeplasma manati]
MKTKTKHDTLVVGVLLILFGAILVISLVTRKSGEQAYIKYKNTTMFAINLENGEFTKANNQTVYTVDALPDIQGDQLLIESIEFTDLTLGQGIVKYQNNYFILGNLGFIWIEYKDNKVRVKEETSPYNICSRVGFSDLQPIICLPNYVTIEFRDLGLDVII